MIESLPPAPGAVVAGVYRILKPLGEHDGVASYLAEQPGEATPRVLTILSSRLAEDPAVRARFEPDLRAGSGVVSPHVARVLAAGIDAATEHPWLAREALKGESLASFAESRGAITVGEVADLFEQLCHGVGAIHAAGLAHCDLRPATIFLETPAQPGVAWSVRVLDLGLAPWLALARRTPTVGEPLWISPEQAEARPPFTAATDVWSLGLIAFFLLVGKSYWKGASAGSMLPAAVHQEVVFDPLVAASTRAAELGILGRIPDGFDAWFARCVARLPSERFADARAALAALRASWGASARAPLPSFSLGEDAARAPLPSLSLSEVGGSAAAPRLPLPSFPLGFEGESSAGSPPSSSSRGPAAGAAPGPHWGPPPAHGGPSHAGPGPAGPGYAPPPGPQGPPGYAGPPYPTQGYGPPPPTWGVAQPARASNPLPWILGVVGLLLFMFVGIGAAGLVYFRRTAAIAPPSVAASTSSTATEWGSVPISPTDPSWGSRTAPVTIVEFGDLQCPFCKKVDATLATLKTQYGPDTLRIVWKHNPLPFHKEARPAAEAALAVFQLGGSEAFWHFHDRALASQDALNDESFASWALETGVDMGKWRSAVTSRADVFKIDADISLAKGAGVRGTPAFFVNGISVAGAQPLDKFVEVIDAQKIAARDALAAGMRPEDVYARLSLENKAKAPPAKEAAADKDDTTVWRVPVGSSPSRGLLTAPVTIVEFGDFQCPFCRRAEVTLADMRTRYGAKVRIVWKNNPLAFHTHAEPAAEIAMEAHAAQGDAVFWQMHDLLYENQAHLEDTDLLGYARRLRLPGAAAALADKKHATQIRADQALAKSLDATGTPTFFINGRRLSGAQSPDKFATIIDEEIRHAAAILARGVAPTDIYAEIQKTAVAGK